MTVTLFLALQYNIFLYIHCNIFNIFLMTFFNTCNVKMVLKIIVLKNEKQCVKK